MVRRRKKAIAKGGLSPDLVKRILRFVVAADPELGSHHTARRTLYNCCLVSRQWRLSAQPLLWSSIKFFAPEDLAKVRKLEHERRKAGGKPGRGLGQHTHTLQIGTFDGELNDLDDIRFVLEDVPNVEDLRFQSEKHDDEIVSIFMLTENNKVRRITLVDMILDCSHPSICPPLFTNVVEPSLMKLRTKPADLQAILTPTSFPSLRALFIAKTVDPDGKTFFPDFSPKLFYRLSALQYQYGELEHVPLWITAQCRVPVLAEVHMTLLFKLLHHPRLSYNLLSSLKLSDPNFAHLYPHLVATVRALETLVRAPRDAPLAL